jgi:superfamily II DNA or RNA helicase
MSGSNQNELPSAGPEVDEADGIELLPWQQDKRPATGPAVASVEPRDYQQRITSKAIEMFEGRYRNPAGEPQRAAHSVMIESPTGSGKTIIGLTVARWMQQTRGYSIGWVSMRRNLLAQAAEENERRGFQVDMQLISMFDKRAPKVDMLVVDEAQHDGAMSMANLHCRIRPQKVLGMTATPFRTDRIKLCFDQIITDVGIHQLIQDGYLSHYHHYTIPEYTPESVARFFVAEPQRWGKSLVFFHRHEQCVRCQQVLDDYGVSSEVVTGTTNRERQLGDFEAGRISLLINMNVLSEGFDCPSLNTVFCRPSGRGPTIQMGGRVFRKHPGLPFKQIVQCQQTRHPFVKTALAEEQYVWMDDSWRTLKLNARIGEISNITRNLIGQCQATLPKLVARHRPRSLHGQWLSNGD